MLAFPANAQLQDSAANVLANVGSIDLAAKRASGVPAAQPAHPDVETMATRNLLDCLPAVVAAIRAHPRLGGPRHALHVIVADAGSVAAALDAGADPDWLPPELLAQLARVLAVARAVGGRVGALHVLDVLLRRVQLVDVQDDLLVLELLGEHLGVECVQIGDFARLQRGHQSR